MSGNLPIRVKVNSPSEVKCKSSRSKLYSPYDALCSVSDGSLAIARAGLSNEDLHMVEAA